MLVNVHLKVVSLKNEKYIKWRHKMEVDKLNNTELKIEIRKAILEIYKKTDIIEGKEKRKWYSLLTHIARLLNQAQKRIE